jgi:hypothetical protein
VGSRLQQVWHDKDVFLLKDHISAKLEPILQSFTGNGERFLIDFGAWTIRKYLYLQTSYILKSNDLQFRRRNPRSIFTDNPWLFLDISVICVNPIGKFVVSLASILPQTLSIWINLLPVWMQTIILLRKQVNVVCCESCNDWCWPEVSRASEV